MAALMTTIMKSARSMTVLQHKPLDLRWNNYTRHTCDRFIEEEDMRSEPEISSMSDDEIYTPPSQLLPSGQKYVVSDNIQHGKESLSFSIASIIGDGKDERLNEQEIPAQVSSPYRNGYLEYQQYLMDTKILNTNENLSPVRGVSMMNSQPVFWCHVCNCPIDEQRDAEKHQIVHRLQESKCNLKRSLLGSHGYVTPHELMDSERIKCGLCCKVVSTCFFSKHQRLHDGHFCSVCDQEFPTNSRLADHMNVHSGKTPFVCKICDRKFAKRSSLTQHLRYHRDNKSFMCRFCYKCFNSKYACAVHERLHTGENPFQCKYPGCKRAYPQKIQLKLHINSHHR